MNTPNKAELKKRIEVLEKENICLKEKVEQLNDILFILNHLDWYAKIPKSIEVCKQKLEKAIPNGIGTIIYLRVDAMGYWFQYTLKSSPNNILTYRVTHEEII